MLLAIGALAGALGVGVGDAITVSLLFDRKM